MKKLGRILRVGHRITGRSRDPHASRGRLGVRTHRHRRRFACGLQPGACRMKKTLSAAAFLRAGDRLLRRAGSHGARDPDRQRCRAIAASHFAQTCRELGVTSSFHANPTRHAPTARPNASSRARCVNGPMRAPIRARIQRIASLVALAPWLQLASPARELGSTATHLQTRTQQEQPVQTPHLGRGARKTRCVRSNSARVNA